MGLIKTLVDRAYKINNTWLGFHEDINKLTAREHLVSDRAFHIFKHLQDSAHCHTLCSADNFHVLDQTSTGFDSRKKRLFIFKENNHL